MSVVMVCLCSMSDGILMASAESKQEVEGVCALAGGGCSKHGMSMLQRSLSRDAAENMNEAATSQEENALAPKKLSLIKGEAVVDDKSKSCEGQPNLGQTAALDETGFFTVRAKCCPNMMVEFIRRLIRNEDAAMDVCTEGSLHGLSHFFDCTDDDDTIYDFNRLLVEIRSNQAQAGPCPWIGYPATVGCPARDPNCPSFPGVTNPPCATTGVTSTVPPTCFEVDVNYQGIDIRHNGNNPGAGAQTPLECQSRCAAEVQCTHFTFRTLQHAAGSIGCWLKDFSASQTVPKNALTGVVSGPKKC